MYRPFEAFEPGGRCISVIGSGGKTTLLRHLSRRFSGTVILTTSTHIYPFPDLPLVETVEADAPGERRRVLQTLEAALAVHRVICLGTPQPSGKLSAPEVPFEALRALADYVIVEADGAAGRPLKAHRPWEPVIPPGSELTVCVVGASGLEHPASEVCHCPELFCALAETAPDQPVRAEHVARALNREALADCYLVNQTDALPDPEIAVRLCALIQAEAFPCALSPR